MSVGDGVLVRVGVSVSDGFTVIVEITSDAAGVGVDGGHTVSFACVGLIPQPLVARSPSTVAAYMPFRSQPGILSKASGCSFAGESSCSVSKRVLYSASIVPTFIVAYNISQTKGFVNWVSRRYSLIRQLAALLADGGQGREGVGVFVGTRLTVGLTSGLGVGVEVGINVVCVEGAENGSNTEKVVGSSPSEDGSGQKPVVFPG